MPQLILEFSPNIIEKDAMPALLHQCHETLAAMLPTDINSCKSRAIECTNFYIGDGNKQHAFVHMTLQVMPGRPEELREKVAATMMQILKSHFTESFSKFKLQITLGLYELPKIYLKVAST